MVHQDQFRNEVQKITINDVARIARVSPQTVSRVINNRAEIKPSTRVRVQGVIDELGYRPSALGRSLATKRTFTIGLVLPDITNPFFPEVVLGAEQVAMAHDYSLILSNTSEIEDRERNALHLLEDKSVDGVVVFSARMPDAALLPLLKRHKAAVLFNRHVDSEIAGVVRIEDGTGLRLAIEHVYQRGCRHVAYLAGPQNAYNGRERLQSFQTQFPTLAPDAKAYVSDHSAPNFSGGQEAAGGLLDRHPCIDAFLCYNDMVAVGALQACSDRSLHVPRDIAIVGHDDILLSRYITPPLTTLRVHAAEIGQTAITMLLDRLNEQPGSPEIFLSPELVVRKSSEFGSL